jgi:hypothetical protein
MQARTCFVLLLLSAALGCGGGPTIIPVEGVVKINGKPAGNLLIQFTPESWSESSKVLSATAVSNPSGKFVLTCDNGRPGATPGKHKVTVLDNNLSAEGEPPPGGVRKVVPNRIPGRYLSASTTPLEVVVEVGKKEYEVNVLTR